MNVLGKVLLALLPDDLESIFKFALLFVVVPVLVIAVIFAGPITAFEKVPLINAEQLKWYIDAAEKVKEEFKMGPDWRELVAVDAVRFEQDFSKASPERAYNLAQMFIKNVGEVVTEKGLHFPVYKLLSLDEVLNMLDFTEEEKDKVKEFLEFLKNTDISSLLDSGVPDGWVPAEKTLKWPVPGIYNITSGFGPRIDPVYGVERLHAGVDIGAPAGTPVRAALDGEVAYAGWNDGYGLVVFIWHNSNLETRYAHLSSIAVKQRQIVRAGDVIGYVGSTGKSTGPHLHFEVRIGGKAVNPLDFFK
ncbi:M23 family metallopeptidase [Thermoanaerobacter wiegelii]|uniref:Peptidase M23 n=1 Tax=Thermoanaerobacter wiegelii Rt8.B1 TaxID=697303 RepID=G2MRM3_9THEO|nr:M23 family metallopeptidase [Thermoanaerobacter wiegelii]AEM79754.1 Peptidase M23 [Thermoanaerobacter wiegelii Rt8.B1]